MKKLLTLLLVFSFAFSVSAVASVQSKLPDKAKVEKTIFSVDYVAVVSLKCEKLQEISRDLKVKKFPSCVKHNYNFKQSESAEYLADISRKPTYNIPIIA